MLPRALQEAHNLSLVEYELVCIDPAEAAAAAAADGEAPPAPAAEAVPAE